MRHPWAWHRLGRSRPGYRLAVTDPILSDRDRTHPRLAEMERDYLYP